MPTAAALEPLPDLLQGHSALQRWTAFEWVAALMGSAGPLSACRLIIAH